MSFSENARVYSVLGKIERIWGDAYELLRGLQRCKSDNKAGTTAETANNATIQVVLLAPPWGGVDYDSNCTDFDVNTM